MKIPIAIVDDKSQNRISLSEQIKYSDDIEILFCAANGYEFLDLMKQCNSARSPAVVLMDIEMPAMDGIQAVQHGHLLYPDLKFLMLTVFDDDEKIFEAIQSGASGYLMKDENAIGLHNAITGALLNGSAPMSPAIARKAFDLLGKATMIVNEKQTHNQISSLLSEREKEILELTIHGLDAKRIAETLGISTLTVRKHIANVYEKLQVNSKAQIMTLAHQYKWFE